MKMYLDDSIKIDGEKEPYEALELAIKDKTHRYLSANARKLLRDKANGISIIERTKTDIDFLAWMIDKVLKHDSKGPMHTIHYLRLICAQYQPPVKELEEDV